MKKTVLLCCAILMMGTGCVSNESKNSVSQVKTQTQGQKKMGLQIEDLVVGNGAEAVKGKNITVHYTGWLTDGTKFDSSVDRKQPFTLRLGAGQVIQGWEEGFNGMKVGGKRKLTIPPEMGYGSRAVGGVIPANSTLIFEVELLRVSE